MPVPGKRKPGAASTAARELLPHLIDWQRRHFVGIETPEADALKAMRAGRLIVNDQGLESNVRFWG